MRGVLWADGANRCSRQLWRRSRRDGKARTMTRPPSALPAQRVLREHPLGHPLLASPQLHRPFVSCARESAGRRPVHPVHPVQPSALRVHPVHRPGHRRHRTPSSRLSQPPWLPSEKPPNRPPLSPRTRPSTATCSLREMISLLSPLGSFGICLWTY